MLIRNVFYDSEKCRMSFDIWLWQKKASASIVEFCFFYLFSMFYKNDIKVCQAPHLNGLHTRHFTDFIVNKWKCEWYLSSNYVDNLSNWSWFCNIGIYCLNFMS